MEDSLPNNIIDEICNMKRNNLVLERKLTKLEVNYCFIWLNHIVYYVLIANILTYQCYNIEDRRHDNEENMSKDLQVSNEIRSNISMNDIV